MLEGYREVRVFRGERGINYVQIRGVSKGRKVSHGLTVSKKEDIQGVLDEAEKKFRERGANGG